MYWRFRTSERNHFNVCSNIRNPFYAAPFLGSRVVSCADLTAEYADQSSRHRQGAASSDLRRSGRAYLVHARGQQTMVPPSSLVFSQEVACLILYCARRTKAGSSGLSRLSGLSGWSDLKFIKKNQKDQPTRQTNPGALREHRRHSVQSHVYPIHPYRGVAKAALYCAHRTSTF